MNRFQPVPDIRQGAADNDTHRIIHEGSAHFCADIDLSDIWDLFSSAMLFLLKCLHRLSLTSVTLYDH